MTSENLYAGQDIRQRSYINAGLLIAAVIVVLDQLSKWAAFEKILRHDGGGLGFFTWLFTRIPADEIFARGEEIYRNIIIAPFLNIVMVWNKGVSFGFFAADGFMNSFLLITVALIVCIFMAAGLRQTTRRVNALAFALIIGGALGNVIDRIRFGAVADFIDVHVAGYHWPAFNLADSAIVLGAVLLIIDALFSPETPSEGTLS